MSVPRSVGQLPVYYSKHPSHNYIDLTASPLYTFGYGLSYTNFDYSDLEIIPSNNPDVYQTVKCNITNTGEKDGDEVVQLYIRDVVGSVETPHRLLKGFKRIHLKRGEIQQVSFDLLFDDLALYNIEMQQVVEPGKFDIMIGASSNDIRLKGSFNLE